MQRSLTLVCFLLVAWSVKVKSDEAFDVNHEDAGSATLPSDDEDFTEGSGASGDQPYDDFFVNEPEISTTTKYTATTTEKDEVRVPKKFEPEVTDKQKDLAEESTGPKVDTLLGSSQFLAALIVGGCVGLLFAICVILLLAYRMRKKDEGSYALDDQKKPVTSPYKYSQGQEYYA